MAQVKVHDFNTLLVQEKVHSLGIFRLRYTNINMGRVLLQDQ